MKKSYACNDRRAERRANEQGRADEHEHLEAMRIADAAEMREMHDAMRIGWITELREMHEANKST